MLTPPYQTAVAEDWNALPSCVMSHAEAFLAGWKAAMRRVEAIMVTLPDDGARKSALADISGFPADGDDRAEAGEPIRGPLCPVCGDIVSSPGVCWACEQPPDSENA